MTNTRVSVPNHLGREDCGCVPHVLFLDATRGYGISNAAMKKLNKVINNRFYIVLIIGFNGTDMLLLFCHFFMFCVNIKL